MTTNVTTDEITFTLDELLQALSGPDSPGDFQLRGWTTSELAERLNMSERTVRKRLTSLIAAGKVRHIRAERIKMTGDVQKRDAYEWVQ